jgi:uncharacterized iron-regulated membrane protein
VLPVRSSIAIMKSQTLVQQHPPTPPSVGADQTGLHQVAQYNADRDYSYNDLHSAAYSSSGAILHDGETFGLGIQYVCGIICLARVDWLTKL